MKSGIKLVVVGGGSSYTPEFIEGIISRADSLPVREIWLVDVKEGEEKLGTVAELGKRMLRRAGLEIDLRTTLDRREALPGADFVISQIRVGGIDARIRDEKIPLRYGVIGQETTGPGGFACALRTIPVALGLCRDVVELAPGAWLLNFTNPSGIVTEAILKHGGVRAIGLCNVPINIQNAIAAFFKVPRKEVFVRFAGLNHLVWGLQVFVSGKDVTDEVLGLLGSEKVARAFPSFAWDADFLRGLGAIPCPYHRYYYMPEKMIEETRERTRGEVVKEIEKKLFAKYKDPALDTKPKELSQRGGALYSDVACDVMASIVNDRKDLHVVNVMNSGALADLPHDVVIETNCVVGAFGAVPLATGKLPPQLRGLLQRVKAYEELTIEAAVTGDYAMALNALVANPLVPSVSIARKILDDVIAENREYLPQFK